MARQSRRFTVGSMSDDHGTHGIDGNTTDATPAGEEDSTDSTPRARRARWIAGAVAICCVAALGVLGLLRDATEAEDHSDEVASTTHTRPHRARVETTELGADPAPSETTLLDPGDEHAEDGGATEQAPMPEGDGIDSATEHFISEQAVLDGEAERINAEYERQIAELDEAQRRAQAESQRRAEAAAQEQARLQQEREAAERQRAAQERERIEAEYQRCVQTADSELHAALNSLESQRRLAAGNDAASGRMPGTGPEFERIRLDEERARSAHAAALSRCVR